MLMSDWDDLTETTAQSNGTIRDLRAPDSHLARMERPMTDDAARDVITLLRAEFVRRLTVDSAHHDRRRRDYNQAIFNAEEGWAIWTGTTIDMVMSKFDDAVDALIRNAPGHD